MYPTTISYSCVVTANSVRHGHHYITYTDLGDLKIDMPFSEYVLRSTSGPDHGEMIAHLVKHSDEESLVESIIKSGMGRKIAMELNRKLFKEVA
ncbi:hypothetical protein [Xenorhabdus littoralis]|uniref:hypothetical protein n=1 Tax=Xenorhabdus littoralis TaxID=2582835 RepID=UPI0029E7D954|nr:hypothetical protein [Xenorhabdus sp. psl]MDX7992619.1 hypothetical protein [Xenorhabdus sp. psl]